MVKTKTIIYIILILVFTVLINQMAVCREKILYDVPYRNQVLDFPGWSQNWASCGYTSTLMNLLYCEALPTGMSEQLLIEKMYADCSITTEDGSVIFYYEKLDEFCEQNIPEHDLEVRFIRNDFESEIKKAIDGEMPVICGTYIFGNVGHVILIVGYDDNNWVVHDPANDWGQERWPDGGFTWKNADFVRFPIGSFTILYGASIFSENSKEFAAKIVEQSPTVALSNEGEMKMLWVKLKNNGTGDWTQEKIHLGTYQPLDRLCGLVAKSDPEKYRWLETENRLMMEQKKVEPGQTAIFGIPMEKNGFVGNFPESFRLINDDQNGRWFGPIVSWNVECLPTSASNQVVSNFSGKYCFHAGNIHNHSSWSGEKMTIAQLVEQGKTNGLKFLGITDKAEKLGDNTNICQYLSEIKTVADEKQYILPAGIEYNVTNYGNKIYSPNESGIRVIGLGYNNLQPQDLPDWFPWEVKGGGVTWEKLTNWHFQHGLPLFIAHPLDKGKNGWSAKELIEKNMIFELGNIAGIEIFSKINFPSLFAINGNNMIGLFNPGLNLENSIELYKNFLGPVGMGVLGGESPAKTIIVTESSQLKTEQIIEAISKKKTIAINNTAAIDFIKISNKEWAPGNWEQTIISGGQVKIEGQALWLPNSSQQKCLYIIRNNKLIHKKLIEGRERINFSFTDNCHKPGKYSYQIAICEKRANQAEEGKLFTSPIYVEVKDKDQVENLMETVNEQQKELLVFTPTIHLGDSFYEGEINRGFKREKAESVLVTKIFSLSSEDFVDLSSCQLQLEVCGAQLEKDSNQGNPIVINCQKIGECLIPNEDPQKNNLVYKYVVPLSCLKIGNNELFIRSLPRAYYLRNGKTFIDFDDFEIRDIKLVFCYGGNNFRPDTNSVGLAKKIPLKNESEELSFISDYSLDEFSQESKKIIDNFEQKGGKFVTDTDYRYPQFLALIEPIVKNIEKLPQRTAVKWKFFESNTLDPIALPDRTILVPTGLLTNEKELPENKIFPIVSAIFQSDLGISHKQANRKDLAGVLGFLGTVLTKNENIVAKYTGMGLLLVGSLSLKSEDEDFYIADAYAYDWMKQNGLGSDQAFSLLDAAGRLEKYPGNNQEYNILAPPADKRLEALTNYIYWQNTYPLPITPDIIDWEKALEKKDKN